MRGWIVGSLVFVAAFFGLLMLRPEPKKLPTAKASDRPLTTAPKPALMIAVPRKTILQRQPGGHFFADARVDGHSVRFLVDTGASVVALTTADAQRMGISFDPATFTVIGRGASGDVYGTVIKLGSLTIGEHEVRDIEAAIIADGLDVSLLGQSWLSRIGTVQISGDTMTLG